MCIFQINSCSHYGALYPWLTVLSPAYTTSYQHQEALYKLQVKRYITNTERKSEVCESEQ